jgi:hypothetical protein
MSDMQMGTRGMSSSDLTRLKRLRGNGYDFSTNKLNVLATNKDIHPTPVRQISYPPNFHLPREMGSSRIRRTASSWTGYKAFLTADQVTQQQLQNGKLLIATKICDCSTTFPKKQGLCPSCLK